ncbi:hypothetical protein, partial [Bacillus pumilus]|uniref:hypothetical protein n=1 Tax=Bacillus pumilus TaxID=1408 RepID=UPI001C930244
IPSKLSLGFGRFADTSQVVNSMVNNLTMCIFSSALFKPVLSGDAQVFVKKQKAPGWLKPSSGL